MILLDSRKFRYLELDSLDLLFNDTITYFEVSEEDFNDVVVAYRDLYTMRYDFSGGKTRKIFTDKNTGLDDFIVECL